VGKVLKLTENKNHYMKNLEKELSAAKRAAEEAGALLIDGFNKKHEIMIKEKNQIVTEFDLKSEQKILSILKKEFPDYSVLSEESGEQAKESEYMWIVDPLDGTTNYSVRNPFFDVAISLVKDDDVVLGVIHSPVLKETFHAVKGRGAFLNSTRIHVSDETDISKIVSAYCYKHTRLDDMVPIFEKISPSVRTFSHPLAAQLELAFVSAGRYGFFVGVGLPPWDFGAGCLIVEEACGKVTDFQNKKWDINSKDMLASNGKVHEEILKIIGE
jgi:myo-inositol-1(or 4)-monophosphatase